MFFYIWCLLCPLFCFAPASGTTYTENFSAEWKDRLVGHAFFLSGDCQKILDGVNTGSNAPQVARRMMARLGVECAPPLSGITDWDFDHQQAQFYQKRVPHWDVPTQHFQYRAWAEILCLGKNNSNQWVDFFFRRCQEMENKHHIVTIRQPKNFSKLSEKYAAIILPLKPQNLSFSPSSFKQMTPISPLSYEVSFSDHPPPEIH